MKKLYSALIAALMIFAVGCATLETNSYRVIGTTAASVDGAMNAWGDWVRAGQATDAQQAKVRQAYETYQDSMAIAEIAVGRYRAGMDSQRTGLDIALDVLAGSATRLIALVQQLTTQQVTP